MTTVTTFTIDELLDILVDSPAVVKAAKKLGYKNWCVRLVLEDDIVNGFELLEGTEEGTTNKPTSAKQ